MEIIADQKIKCKLFADKIIANFKQASQYLENGDINLLNEHKRCKINSNQYFSVLPEYSKNKFSIMIHVTLPMDGTMYDNNDAKKIIDRYLFYHSTINWLVPGTDFVNDNCFNVDFTQSYEMNSNTEFKYNNEYHPLINRLGYEYNYRRQLNINIFNDQLIYYMISVIEKYEDCFEDRVIDIIKNNNIIEGKFIFGNTLEYIIKIIYKNQIEFNTNDLCYIHNKFKKQYDYLISIGIDISEQHDKIIKIRLTQYF